MAILVEAMSSHVNEVQYQYEGVISLEIETHPDGAAKMVLAGSCIAGSRALAGSVTPLCSHQVTRVPLFSTITRFLDVAGLLENASRNARERDDGICR